MAVKRLEERLTEYNILETGWEINYHEVMAGGQGRVYPVKKNIGNKVLIEAIKVISIPSEGEEQQWKYKSESTIKTQITKRKEEAKKEYEMLLELKGNHVIPVRDVLEKSFDLINEGDQLGYDIIIRMDYLSSLENYLFENNFQSFSNEEIVNCGIQICTALNCLHNRNMAHRDIKPGNIFVSKVSDGNLMFYLGDFGSVKESSMGLSIGRSRTISGTELYLAPYWENTQYRIQRDLYSLGLTLFWMATGGNLPYEETNCKEIMDDEREGAYIKRRISQKELPTGDINDKIASVIKKACSVKKEDEINIVPTSYINATQMRKALEKIKESKGQNVEKNIIKVEDESTEDVVSDLELTVPKEKIKQKPVERIFTKQDYKGEQILEIGDEYTGIADYALQGTPIVELNIGASVKTFGRKIWVNCRSLKKLKVENYETVYEGDFDDCNRLEEVILPNCKNISENAFSNSYGKSSCQFLERIDAPKCEKVGACAFEDCTALKEIELGECVEVGEKAFYNCEKLTRIHMPKCEQIGGSAFFGCKNIQQIELPQCEDVGQYAFSGCTSLRYINLPKCKRLGARAFSGDYLRDSTYNVYDVYGVCKKDDMYDRSSLNLSACYKLEDVMLPQCEEVGQYAFSGCVSLRHINLPKCKRLGESAFSGCKYKYQRIGEFKGLESVEIPQCVEIEDLAFYKCDNLQTVKAESCKKIGTSAFEGCVKLEIVECPECELIESHAFRDCNGLKKINNQKCKEVQSCAFWCCKSIKEIEILECETVGESSFAKCDNLQRIIMPKCSQIGTNAFEECWNLKELQFAKDANWSRVGFAVQKIKNKMRKKR